MSVWQIAIDGPASSGKSTIAKLLAQQLNIIYLDTGAMYRAVTLQALRNGIESTDELAMRQLLENMQLSFEWIDGVQHLFIDGEDVSDIIRTKEVTQAVSQVAAEAYVRQHLVALQQEMARSQSVVMDGRDIGTVVLPQATHKFFFTASPAVRAKRRYEENQLRGLTDETLEEIEAAIIARDHYDSTREHSPLVKANDAIEVDTSHLTIEEVVATLMLHIQSQ